MKHAITLSVLTTLVIMTSLPGCSSSGGENMEYDYPITAKEARREKRGKLTGEGGLDLFGGGKDQNNGSSSIGVNSFLWRATLDTLSFMPLSSVDPHGGVIITDWYEDPAARGERFKLNVLILSTALRSDAVKVSVFKQTQTESGTWRDATVQETTARDLEDKILTRARELRINNAS